MQGARRRAQGVGRRASGVGASGAAILIPTLTRVLAETEKEVETGWTVVWNGAKAVP